MNYDYIIIGGGTAGAVLTNRLSEDPKNKVLVLEAGRPDYKLDFRIHMPAALSYLLTGDNYNWDYHSDPEPYMNGRRIAQPRGKARECLKTVGQDRAHGVLGWVDPWFIPFDGFLRKKPITAKNKMR